MSAQKPNILPRILRGEGHANGLAVKLHLSAWHRAAWPPVGLSNQKEPT